MLSKHQKINATKALTYCSLLAALSVVLARFLVITPNESTRFSLEAVPIFLAGLLFGPASGAMVGFAADFIGCLISPFGYNPIFSIPPILYGLFAGLARRYVSAKTNPLRLLLSFLPPVVLGSLLYQSAALAFMYYDGLFPQGFLFYLTTRSIQFAITLVLDVLMLYIVLHSGVFQRLHLWPIPQKSKGGSDRDC